MVACSAGGRGSGFVSRRAGHVAPRSGGAGSDRGAEIGVGERSGAGSQRLQHAARADHELEGNVAAARKRLAELRAEKASRSRTHKNAEKKKQGPKISTTDARTRFDDGGAGAGNDLQLAASADGYAIVGGG